MLRYYETVDNLGSAFVNNLLFQKPVTMISSPDPQFDIVSGYTNDLGNAGQLRVFPPDNTMVFNLGLSVTPTIIGEYVLFDLDGDEQIVVDVTDLTFVLSTVELDFILEPIVNDLFDPIATQLAIDGGDRYRCIAIRNDDPTLIFQNGKIWVKSQVLEGEVSIGFDPTGVNGTPTTSDGITVPVGVSFSAPITEGTGVVIPTLNPNDHIFLWIKRTNPAATSENTFRLTLDVSGTYV